MESLICTPKHVDRTGHHLPVCESLPISLNLPLCLWMYSSALHVFDDLTYLPLPVGSCLCPMKSLHFTDGQSDCLSPSESAICSSCDLSEPRLSCADDGYHSSSSSTSNPPNPTPPMPSVSEEGRPIQKRVHTHTHIYIYMATPSPNIYIYICLTISKKAQNNSIFSKKLPVKI